VNTARPNAAEMPQKRVASAMKIYPRRIGCPGLTLYPAVCSVTLAVAVSLGECLLDTLWVKPDQYLVSDHYGRRGTAVISSDQLKYGYLVLTDVSFRKLDSSLREESLHCLARRSTGLAEDYHLLLLCHSSPQVLNRSGRAT
jgi:hypothetical protein